MAKTNDLTKMGQSGEPGEPDPAAIADLEKINADLMTALEEAERVNAETAQEDMSPQMLAMQEQIKALQASLPREMRPPSGEYKRDYDKDRKNLAVTGGLEVRHAPDFVPTPPSYIPMYVGAAGGTTPSENLSLRGPDGKPVKTDIYKRWLDAKMDGTTLTGDVRNEILHNPEFSSDSSLQEFIEI